MKKLLAFLIIGCIVFAAGCTGSFKLTKSVHKWQTGFENKWVDEVAFLGCIIIPVYELATLGDAIIFNTIEFWTGESPAYTLKLVEGAPGALFLLDHEVGQRGPGGDSG